MIAAKEWTLAILHQWRPIMDRQEFYEWFGVILDSECTHELRGIYRQLRDRRLLQ